MFGKQVTYLIITCGINVISGVFIGEMIVGNKLKINGRNNGKLNVIGTESRI